MLQTSSSSGGGGSYGWNAQQQRAAQGHVLIVPSMLC